MFGDGGHVGLPRLYHVELDVIYSNCRRIQPQKIEFDAPA